MTEPLPALSPAASSPAVPCPVVPSPAAPSPAASSRRVILFLLLAPPAIAELLSGSSPPRQFFHPVGLVVLVLLYGGGTLLIRELRARWGLQWAVLLPAIAYGVLEEGTAIQSFFNHNHVDLRLLSGYGTALGVQWPWTLQVTIFHATISTLIPLTIADLLWPELRRRPLLRRRGLILTAAGLGLATLLLMVVIWLQQRTMARPYQPSLVLVGGSALAVGALVGTAYLLRRSTVTVRRLPLAPPALLGALAFLVQAVNLVLPNNLAERGVAAGTTVAAQLVLVAVLLAAGFSQLCHRELTPRHRLAVVTGSLLCFVLLTPVHELVEGANPDPADGMILVGLTALGLLLLLRRRVLVIPP